MKKRVFKYKLVYWISIFVSIITLGLFATASINRINYRYFTTVKLLLFSCTTFLITILAIISTLFLMIKSRYSVKVFSLMLYLLMGTFSIGILDSISFKKDFDYNTETFIIVFFLYAITFALLWMVNRFKYQNLFEEIEEIGIQNLN